MSSTQPNLFQPHVTLGTKLVGEVHMSSGWFDAIEPFRTTFNAGKKACGYSSPEFRVVPKQCNAMNRACA